AAPVPVQSSLVSQFVHGVVGFPLTVPPGVCSVASGRKRTPIPSTIGLILAKRSTLRTACGGTAPSRPSPRRRPFLVCGPRPCSPGSRPDRHIESRRSNRLDTVRYAHQAQERHLQSTFT